MYASKIIAFGRIGISHPPSPYRSLGSGYTYADNNHLLLSLQLTHRPGPATPYTGPETSPNYTGYTVSTGYTGFKGYTGKVYCADTFKVSSLVLTIQTWLCPEGVIRISSLKCPLLAYNTKRLQLLCLLLCIL